MKPKICIFSSNQELLFSTKNFFTKEGLAVTTYVDADETIINELYRSNPDIILLDLDILNTDGIELCYKLTSENALNAFVVLFSEHFEEYIQIEAFKAGADDYVARPINPRVLLKRMQALLRRKPQNKKLLEPQILSHKSLKIDRNRYLIFKEAEEFSLPRKEFEMLYLLLNEPQKVFSREEIYKHVWNKETSSNDRIIDVHIRKIREKIGEGIINTVKGVGYQLA